MFEKLIHDLSRLEAVEAIALGGSRAGSNYDASSDYDVYLYCTGPVAESVRKAILSQYCSTLEIGNQFWELEDNCQLRNGIDIDILYRNLDDFASDVASVVEQYQARNGYTTCMWHNLLTCKILYDRAGRLQALKQRFCVPYPEPLRQNILLRSWRLLQQSMPAYCTQVRKALHRGDLVSINHRVAAFLESYFDLLFALNRQPHPGEKRLIQLCKERCSVLPDRFEENLESLFRHLYTNPALAEQDIAAILDRLSYVLPDVCLNPCQ